MTHDDFFFVFFFLSSFSSTIYSMLLHLLKWANVNWCVTHRFINTHNRQQYTPAKRELFECDDGWMCCRRECTHFYDDCAAELWINTVIHFYLLLQCPKSSDELWVWFSFFFKWTIHFDTQNENEAQKKLEFQTNAIYCIPLHSLNRHLIFTSVNDSFSSEYFQRSASITCQ